MIMSTTLAIILLVLIALIPTLIFAYVAGGALDQIVEIEKEIEEREKNGNNQQLSGTERSLDQLHPEYGQYVIVNVERGTIRWYESYDAAVRDLVKTGGSIINTATADPAFVKRTLADARKNM